MQKNVCFTVTVLLDVYFQLFVIKAAGIANALHQLHVIANLDGLAVYAKLVKIYFKKIFKK